MVLVWEKKYYDIAALHSVDAGRLHEKKSERMIRYLQGHASEFASVLEIGCGEGALSSTLHPSVTYRGIDVSKYAIENAVKKYGNRPNTEFSVAGSFPLPFQDATQSAVVAHYSLEHFAKPRESLLEMVRVLKQDGVLILVAPNLEFPLSYPSALRHMPAFHRLQLAFLRTGDYILRLFGMYAFRIIKKNYLDATGKYEHGDDDLRYLVSSFEVISFLKRNGMRLEWAQTIDDVKKGTVSRGKRIISHLPGMRYYGTELFAILRKK